MKLFVYSVIMLKLTMVPCYSLPWYHFIAYFGTFYARLNTYVSRSKHFIYMPQISKEYRLLNFCCVPTTSATSSKAFSLFLLQP